MKALKEVMHRKAAAFWIEGTPRTTVRFFLHDTIPTGPPVRLPPHNLKGEAAQWVDEKLQDEIDRGQMLRGNSPWGSPAFPTKEFAEHRRQRKRRIVVDYRRVNARTLRAVYYVRRSDDVKAEAAGSAFLTFLDAATGFNHLVNTRRAREMLAVIARSGQFLPVCLTFGPVNGPEDFSYVVDRTFAPGKDAKRRFCTEWLGYVDDLTVRTGRVIDGTIYTDDEMTDRLKEAMRRAREMRGGQSPAAALAGLGFVPQELGAEMASKEVAGKRPKKKKYDPVEVDRNAPFAHGLGEAQDKVARKSVTNTSLLSCLVCGVVPYVNQNVENNTQTHCMLCAAWRSEERFRPRPRARPRARPRPARCRRRA